MKPTDEDFADVWDDAVARGTMSALLEKEFIDLRTRVEDYEALTIAESARYIHLAKVFEQDTDGHSVHDEVDGCEAEYHKDGRPGGRSYDDPVNPQPSPEDMTRWVELDDVAETSGVLSPNESTEYNDLADKYGWYVEEHYAGGTVDWATTQGGGYLPIRQAEIAMKPTGNFDPSVAVKNDSDKSCRPELIDPAFTKGVGRVLAFGAHKYAAGNWAKGMEWSRLIGALERHILAFKSGEEIDPETGECHLYHAGCMLAFLSSHWEHNLGVDDREEIGVMWPHSPEGTQSERNGKV